MASPSELFDQYCRIQHDTTRQALKDGTNGVERVLPGAERRYPASGAG